MLEANWLPLTDYSTKYKVSVSTLRRRIKAEDIHYKFAEGKYFISDQPVGTQQKDHRPSPKIKSESPLLGAYSAKPAAAATSNSQDKISMTKLEPPVGASAGQQENIWVAANQLLSELKKAYMAILQEKEEQILYLKDEAADLKTLVRVLESENARLKGEHQG